MPTRRNFLTKSALGLAALTCFFTGCAPRETAVDAGIRTQTLHIGNDAEPPNLDPHTNASTIAGFILGALNEGLVRISNDGVTIKPGLAEHWEISEDGLVYTFHLRDNAKWSNGEPLVAEDYVAGIQRFLNPELACGGVNRAFPIVGAEDYAEGRNPDPTSVGVSAPDSHAVRIQLRFRAPYFLSRLARNNFVPLNLPMLDQFDGHSKPGGRWTLPGNLISNGPFILKEWQPHVVIVLEKNPHYWQADQVSLQEIHFHPIADSNVEERAFRTGQLHITFGVPYSKLDGYREQNNGVLRSTNILRSGTIAFNTTKPPFNDARVRRAFSLSIDRERLIATVLKGQGVPAYNYTPPMAGGYDLPSMLKYDVSAARRQLAEAGYPDGAGFPQPELLLSGRDDEMITLGQALQQMWKDTLGVEVTLAPTEFKVWLDQILNNNYLFASSGWNMQVDDPTDILEKGVSNNAYNEAYWSNAEFDQAFTTINQAGNEAERRAAIIESERIINAHVPWATLYFATRNQLVHPSVQGWQGNPIQVIDWTAISLRSNSSLISSASQKR